MEYDTGVRRIQRERANADRGLRPKRKHMGYLLQRWVPEHSNHGKYVDVRIETPWRIVDYPGTADVLDLVRQEVFPLFDVKEESYGLANFVSNVVAVDFGAVYTGGKYWLVGFKLQGPSSVKWVIPTEVLRHDDDAETDS